MAQTRDQVTITNGMDVVGSEGDKIGEVIQTFPRYVVVQKGFFFPSDYYIPATAMRGADQDTVYLNVTKQEAMQQEPSWDRPPPDAGAMNEDPTPFEHEQDSSRTHVNEDDNLRIDLAEEELTATKRQVDRGDVDIHKEVVSEEQQFDVPVTEERVNVERRAVDREVPPGEDPFSEGDIEVPVHGEEVDVQKRARVTEEIDIDKETVQGTKHASGTVRHEEVVVDDDTSGKAKQRGNGKKKGRK